tara:strand:- start:6579 stop:7394 length:816 start_codon:yes stop_codon:yes gene_type:complete
MITFSNLGKYGRLGNQLFQYAALKGLSVKNGYQIGMSSDIFSSIWHGQKCLLSNFNLNYHTTSSIGRRYNQPGDAQTFDKNFFDLEDGVDILGFFQNLNYFHFCEQQIKEDFKINSKVQKKCDDYLQKFNGTLVSIHVRRGDNINYNQSSQDVIDNYIAKSVDYFNDDVNFLLFTGGSRSFGEDNTDDLTYLKDTYDGDKVFYSETNDPMMDFCLMTKCHHNIISHDSTFSWWAAYLNENRNSTVICPKYHKSLEQNVEYDNFYPDNWSVL